MSLRPAVWNDLSSGSPRISATQIYPTNPKEKMSISHIVHHPSSCMHDSLRSDWHFDTRRVTRPHSTTHSEWSSDSNEESITQQSRSTRTIHRSATVHFRHCRENNIHPTVAKEINGRFYCAYRSPLNNTMCNRWTVGYSTMNELGRHVDSDHAAEESELIERGQLTYRTAQWITSKEQHQIVKENLQSTMSCEACGTRFASCRPDSIGRHLRNGACERARERQSKMSLAPTEHKKKNGLAYLGQPRRRTEPNLPATQSSL